ncbi:MAG: hypothetical protein R2848_15345 [Thermomicrobiales bacterium]
MARSERRTRPFWLRPEFLVLQMAVLFVLVGRIVPLALGDDYLASIPVLRMILIGTVITAVNIPLAAILQATGHELYVAKVIGASRFLGWQVLLSVLHTRLGHRAARVVSATVFNCVLPNFGAEWTLASSAFEH